MTSEVMLREVLADDLLIFFEHQLDPTATWMAAFSSRDRNSFNSHWTRILADETIYKKTIMFEGQVAGNIVSWEHSGEREVGYWIGNEYWGKGIASRELSLFLNYVKERPLYAHVARHNIASFRVLENAGSRLPALMRRNLF